MVLTLAELSETPPGWAEELLWYEQGADQAAEILSAREQRRSAHSQQPQGRPVYGTHGAVLLSPRDIPSGYAGG